MKSNNLYILYGIVYLARASTSHDISIIYYMLYTAQLLSNRLKLGAKYNNFARAMFNKCIEIHSVQHF